MTIRTVDRGCWLVQTLRAQVLAIAPHWCWFPWVLQWSCQLGCTEQLPFKWDEKLLPFGVEVWWWPHSMSYYNKTATIYNSLAFSTLWSLALCLLISFKPPIFVTVGRWTLMNISPTTESFTLCATPSLRAYAKVRFTAPTLTHREC